MDEIFPPLLEQIYVKLLKTSICYNSSGSSKMIIQKRAGAVVYDKVRGGSNFYVCRCMKPRMERYWAEFSEVQLACLSICWQV